MKRNIVFLISGILVLFGLFTLMWLNKAQLGQTTSILLLGLDRKNSNETTLPDFIHIIKINFQDQSIVSIPLPRDLYVEYGSYKGKLNGVERVLSEQLLQNQSFSLLRGVASKLISQPVDYFAAIDMTTFKLLIDSVGGVEVLVRCPFSERFRTENYSFTRYDFPAGMTHMNGDKALAYARYRRTGGDLSRISHQQQILAALQERALSLSWTDKLLTLWRVFRQVRTNISIRMMIRIIFFLDGLQTDKLKGLALSNNDAVDHLVTFNRQRVITINEQLFSSASDNFDQLPKLGTFEQPCIPESIKHGEEIKPNIITAN